MDKKITDAYMTLQDNCGIKVGDTVEVRCSSKSYACGWDNTWAEGPMNATIGKKYKVTGINKYGITLDGRWAYPWFVLKVVEPVPTPYDISINGPTIVGKYKVSEDTAEKIRMLIE